MIIRPMCKEDGLYISELIAQLGYPAEDTVIQQRMERILTFPDYYTFIAEVEGKVVGMVGMLKQFSYHYNDPHLRIMALVVHSDYRRMNIGKELMVAAERCALENGCTSINLNSGNREERRVAHIFYESLGYQKKSIGFVKII